VYSGSKKHAILFLLHASVCLPVVELVVKVANLTFLKPDFKILTFFEHLWLFWKLKKKTKSGFFQSERLGSGKHCLSCILITNLF